MKHLLAAVVALVLLAAVAGQAQARLRPNPGGTIGSVYLCPSYAPYYHGNVLGSGYCSIYP